MLTPRLKSGACARSGIRHLGDLGHRLSSSQVNEIGSVDVLFLPIGGFFTIGPDQARDVMESLKPRIVVPMHYRAPGMSVMFRLLKKVEDFVRPDDDVRRLEGSTFTVSKADVPEKRVIIVPRLLNQYPETYRGILSIRWPLRNWWAWPDSNRRPMPRERNSFLARHGGKAEYNRISAVCSTMLSYRPTSRARSLQVCLKICL